MFAGITLKFKQRELFIEKFVQNLAKGANGMANSVDPDQTASGAPLSDNLGSLQVQKHYRVLNMVKTPNVCISFIMHALNEAALTI